MRDQGKVVRRWEEKKKRKNRIYAIDEESAVYR